MKCGKPATIRYKWGSEDVYQCLEHANQVAALAQHMGWPHTVYFYDGPELCNSETEGKA